jgi:hypothetical protein
VTQFRPTLILGLGGSGTFVARRLKKRLQRVVDIEIPPSIQVLAFDTDQQKPLAMLEELPPTEFHRVSDFQGDNYVTPSALRKNVEIGAFWRYRRLTPGWVRDGARQLPPVGRLAFFVNFARIRKQIEDAIQRMFQRTPRHSPPPDVNAVDLYVVGSCCGGTGAGMFFDVAVLAQQLITRDAREAVLQAHVLLPSCFERSQANLGSLQTNGYAFLKTMEAIQSGGCPAVSYPGISVPAAQKPLFSRVHLIGGVDRSGTRFEDSQSVFENVALQLDLEICGASAREMRSAIDNLPADFNRRPEGRLAIYSSYGTRMLSGSPDIGRLVVTPKFVTKVLDELQNSTHETEGSRRTTVVPEVLNRLEGLLSIEDSVLQEIPGYELQWKRIANTDNPRAAANKLVGTLDSLISAASFEWVNALGDVPREVRSGAERLLESGPGGVSKAAAYLETALEGLNRVSRLMLEVEQEELGTTDDLSKKLDSFFVTKGAQKDILLKQGLPFLRKQAILRIRKVASNKAKPLVAGYRSELLSQLQSLNNFAVWSRTLIDRAETQAREGSEKLRLTLGSNSTVTDTAEFERRFAKDANETILAFFGSPQGTKALARLAHSVLDGKGSEDWGAPLLQAIDDTLKVRLADKAGVPSDWPTRAAEEILRCEPMVQFARTHLSAQPKWSRTTIARVYLPDEVKSALERTTDEQASREWATSDVAGSLEVISMVVNFALYDLQELHLLADAYQRFEATQPEPIENRFAWRGPKEMWSRIERTDLFPLEPEQKALARRLAFDPPPSHPAVFSELATAISFENQKYTVEKGEYEKLSDALAASGKAEELLRQFSNLEKKVARDHLNQVRVKLAEKVENAAAHPKNFDAWENYVASLKEELAAVDDWIEQKLLD